MIPQLLTDLTSPQTLRSEKYVMSMSMYVSYGYSMQVPAYHTHRRATYSELRRVRRAAREQLALRARY